MKKVFLAMAAAAMLFVGCSKDDDNQTIDDTFTAEKVNCTYKLMLDTPNVTELRKAFSLYVDYYDKDGQIQNTEEYIAADFTWQVNVERAAIPSWYGFRFRLTPKSDLSDIEQSATFAFTATLSIEGVCTAANGQTKTFGSQSTLDQSGITPFVDVTYGKSMLFKVMSDGTAEEHETWVE